MPEASDGKSVSDSQVPTQLTSLVPQFDPAQHDLEQYSQKVELLANIWPENKIDELVTRLILGTSGAAFQKLQLQKDELMVGDKAGVEKLVKILGGHWGKVSLERKYEIFEKAVFRCTQRADESNDSFLARADILWTELIASKISMQELQAYVVLRGSLLTAEDKKRVILESEATKSGTLNMEKVTTSVRMLGSGFFHDFTGVKKSKGKVYDAHALVTEEWEDSEETYNAEDWNEDEMVENLAGEGDEDAVLVCEYENAMQDAVQEDESLAATFNAYTDARRRLSERFRNRGFWPTSSSKGKGKGSKGRGKFSGKGNFGNRKSLQQRILESNCRHCGRKGHWRAECPERSRNSNAAAANSAPTMTSMTMIGDTTVEGTLPLEFVHLPEIVESTIDVSSPHAAYVSVHGDSNIGDNRKVINLGDKDKKLGKSRIIQRVEERLGFSPAHFRPRSEPASTYVSSEHPPAPTTEQVMLPQLAQVEPALYATTGAFGILDSGATKTVMGSQLLSDFLRNLQPRVRQQVKRCKCEVTFKFGNQGTLDSQHALVIPIGKLGLKIAIVPGSTPLLLSNTLLRTLKATLDIEKQVLLSPFLGEPIRLNLNNRGLFLVDVNELSMASNGKMPAAETFVHETMDTKPVQNAKDSRAQPVSCPVRERFAEPEKSNKPIKSQSHAMFPDQVVMNEIANKDGPTSNPNVNTSLCQVVQPDFKSTKVQETTTDCPTTDYTRAKTVKLRPAEETVIHQQPPSDTSLKHPDVSRPESPQHVADRSPEPPGTESRRSRHTVRFQGDDTGRNGACANHLRQSSPGQELHGDLDPGKEVADVVCQNLSDIHQARAHEVADLHRTDGGTGRTGESEPSPPDACDATASQAQDKGSSSDTSRDARARSDRGGTMDGVRPDLRASKCSSRRDQSTANPDGEPRRGDARDPLPHPSRLNAEHWAQGMKLAGDIDADESHVYFSSQSELQISFQNLIKTISEEYQSVEQSTSNRRQQRLHLLEVFCSSTSELTKQTTNMGYRAKRFGFAEGDLSCPEGRRKLFQIVCQEMPKNVWFSPTCGPWSSWNNLNAARSIEAFDQIHQQRVQHLYQLALGIVLCRVQTSRGQHFHWEQPRRSLMFRTPLLREIYDQTMSATFDMCRVGQLRDPENKLLMQKGLEVRTTCHDLYSQLHGRYCRHDHRHQVLEGTTIHHGERKNRTEFSELYPRKFARYVSKILCKVKTMPCQSTQAIEQSSAFAAAAKRQQPNSGSIRASDSKRIKCHHAKLIEPSQMPRKRRRLCKSSPDDQGNSELSKDIVESVKPILPRVGKTEIRDPEIINKLQKLFDDKRLVRVIACKGTERTIPPPQGLLAEEAPFRRAMVVQRGDHQVKVEDQWEEWGELAQRQLVRSLVPCYVNITVFACNHPADTSRPDQFEESESPQSSVLERPMHDMGISADIGPSASDTGTNAKPFEPSPETRTTGEQDSRQLSNHTDQSGVHRNVELDIQDKHQGPRFAALNNEERRLLLRLHKNLGHPSSQVLSQVLRNRGYPSHMIQGLQDMKCSTCQHHQNPKIQRPAILKQELDFGDKVSVDGTTWTNKNGKTFHYYHFLDHGTNYHTAVIAPNRTTEKAIEKVTLGWLSWAGPPNEFVADSATEFNNEAFGRFLQQFNTKGRIIPPEAHWQLSKSERHGDILQHMLSKFEEDFPIESYADLQIALAKSTSAKNACSLRHGFSPEVLVFGKGLKVPGSLSSDDGLPAHSLASEESGQWLQFRTQLAMRESARRAFHSADNNAALRRAALRRDRPDRGSYQPGEWIMFWRSNENQKGWVGPAKVIQQDGRSSLFCLHLGNLVRAAPEHVRPVSAVEAQLIQEPCPEVARLIQRPQCASSQEGTGSTAIPVPADQSESRVARQLHEPINTRSHNDITINDQIGNNSQGITSTPQSNSSQQPDQEPDMEHPAEENIHQALRNALETPVPETDDELLCDMLTCTDAEAFLASEPNENLAWRFELEIPQDIPNESNIQIDDLILLATNQKKQRTEVKLSHLTIQEQEEFEKAKASEVNNWLQTGTVSKALRSSLSPEQILKCRWIHVWKPIEDKAEQERQNKTRKAKSRLVVLGYMDPELETIPRDSPTLGRQSRMLLLQLIASMRWSLTSFDIKAAFLQGKTQEGRKIGLEPVPELARAMRLKENEICRLEKSAYGLIDAPFLWFKELDRVLRQLSFVPSPFDPCVYLLYKENSKTPSGVIGMHVDDGLCGGDEYFSEQLAKLEAVFPFGSKKSQNFVFTGIEMTQQHDKSIILSQEKYVTKIEPIHIKSERKQQIDLTISAEEKLELRAIIGSLQYAAVNTRPDLSSRLSHLQSAINTATISTLIEANKTLHEAKRHKDTKIKIQPIDIKQLRFLAFSDASFSSPKQPDSHSGSIIMATHSNITQNYTCPVNAISWGCKKIQKVVVSTLSAETMSLNSTLDQLSWIRLFWGWLLNPTLNWKQPKETLNNLPTTIAAPTLKPIEPSIAVTDCKSLYDLVTRTAPPSCQEYRTQLLARSIKDLLSEGITLRWVHSGAQLADALTKVMQATFLRQTLELGTYKLHDENAILKDRASARSRMQWLHENANEAEKRKH